MSGEATGGRIDLGLIRDPHAGDGGIPHGALLAAFAEAAISGNAQDLDAVRAEVISKMGGEAMIDAAAVVAQFNANDRVADATGIPLDSSTERMTTELRETLGLNIFADRKRGAIAAPLPE